MIDWVTAQIPLLHVPIKTGHIAKVDANGELEWMTPSKLAVPGSWDTNLYIRSEGSDGCGHATHIGFHGNPAKFLQGHNLFGTTDLISLMRQTIDRISYILDLDIKPEDWKAICEGNYTLSRIDITFSYEMKTRSDVKAWIYAAEQKGRSRSGRAERKGLTVYYNKTSRRWTIKFYSKGDELTAKGHGLHADLYQREKLIDWADNKLRCELTLRSTELIENNINNAYQLTPEKLVSLHSEYLERLDMNEQVSLPNEEVLELPRKLQSSYMLWQQGVYLRDLLPKNTFYRHRRELKEHGIDISIARDPNSTSNNVFPLIRVIEAKPVETPIWATTLRLVNS